MQRKTHLLIFILCFSHIVLGQSTYIFNGSNWSIGGSTVSGPVINSASNLEITSGSHTLQRTEQTLKSSIINSKFNIYQTITPTYTGAVESITIWAESVPNSTYTVTLQLYSGDPVGSSVLLAAVSKNTGTIEMEFVMPAGILVTAGGDYFIRVVYQTVNAWRWRLGPNNSYSSEKMYLPYTTDVPQANATIWDPNAYDYDTGQMGAWVQVGNEDSRSLAFSLKYSFQLNNLTIASGAAFSVGKEKLHLQGNLNNSGTLNLNADALSYGQLKIDGTIANSGVVAQSQYISTTGHHAISSPMTAGFTTTSGTASTLYGYNASIGAWDMSPTASTVGAGFFAPVQASGGFQSTAGSFSVTGTPNTSHTHSLGYAANTASGGSGSGWNLIGNPYTCGLDWTSVTKTNVNNAYYVWDASNGTYQYYSGSALSGTYLAASSILSGVIPPMQAFWVQATASGGSIVSTMANDGTVSSSPTFYKTSPDNLILYAEDLNDPSLSDAMWITHAAGYTNNFEGDLDAWKRSNYGGQANIYSYHDGEKMAINALDLSATTSIPVGVKGSEIGKKYRLVLEQLVNNQPYQAVLEDRLWNSFTDITSEGYVFTYGAWQNEEPRFVLHVNESTVGMDDRTSEVIKVFQQGDRLIVLGDGQKHSSFTLVGLDGRQIYTGVLTSGMASILAPNPGVYVILVDGTSANVQRVLIQ